MKILKCLFLLMFTLNFSANSSNLDLIPYDIIDDIASVIKNGNSSRLAVFFSSTINLTVLDNDGTYSKTQAEMIMKDFFTKNPPQNFIIKQRGSSNEGSMFAIGSYISLNGKSFRTYFLLKKINNNFLITMLEFEID